MSTRTRDVWEPRPCETWRLDLQGRVKEACQEEGVQCLRHTYTGRDGITITSLPKYDCSINSISTNLPIAKESKILLFLISIYVFYVGDTRSALKTTIPTVKSIFPFSTVIYGFLE